MTTAMIIDDDPSNLFLLKTVLKRYGYETMAFSRASGALRWLQTTAQLPDVIVLDIYMPDMDGCTFLEHLYSSAQLSRIPVIITTAAAVWDCQALVIPSGPCALLI